MTAKLYEDVAGVFLCGDMEAVIWTFPDSTNITLPWFAHSQHVVISYRGNLTQETFSDMGLGVHEIGVKSSFMSRQGRVVCF